MTSPAYIRGDNVNDAGILPLALVTDRGVTTLYGVASLRQDVLVMDRGELIVSDLGILPRDTRPVFLCVAVSEFRESLGAGLVTLRDEDSLSILGALPRDTRPVVLCEAVSEFRESLVAGLVTLRDDDALSDLSPLRRAVPPLCLVRTSGDGT